MKLTRILEVSATHLMTEKRYQGLSVAKNHVNLYMRTER